MEKHGVVRCGILGVFVMVVNCESMIFTSLITVCKSHIAAELNMNLSMNSFNVHRILGRGGFGEVFGCQKIDTGKMWVVKYFLNYI